MIHENVETFIKRFIGFSIGPAVSAAIGFFMVPVTTRLVVPEEFGKSAMYATAYALFTLIIYLGTDQSFIREYSAAPDKSRLLWNCFVPPLLFSVLVSAVVAVFSDKAAVLLFGSPQPFVIWTLALSLPIAVIHRYNMQLIRMEEKAALYSGTQILQKLIELVLLLLLLFFYERSFRSIVLAQAASVLAIGMYVCLRNIEIWKTKIDIRKEMFRKVLGYGIPLVPSAVFVWCLNMADRVAIRIWSDYHELGLYSAAFKIVIMLELLKNAFATFWSPTAYRWYENGVPAEKFRQVGRMLTAVLALLFGAIVVMKDWIILLLDDSYRDAAVFVPFLLLVPIMYTMAETTKIGISFRRKTMFFMPITGLAAAVNFAGNGLLVPRLGALGASLSAGIAFTVYFWACTFISGRMWEKFDLRFYFVNTFFMVLLAAAAVFYHHLFIELAILFGIVIYNRRQAAALMFRLFEMFGIPRKRNTLLADKGGK